MHAVDLVERDTYNFVFPVQVGMSAGNCKCAIALKETEKK